jgi:predicted nucleic acid-binding protein
MTTSDQRTLVDTNVLVYAADTTAEFHEPSRQLRDLGLRGEISLVVTPQVLMEFFAVVTNPRSPEEAREEIEKYVGSVGIAKIYPHDDALDRMLGLLRQYPQVSRQEIFDCTW